MRTPSGKDISPNYSVVFLLAVMVLLLSCLAVPDFSPYSLSENFRWRTELVQLYTTLRWKAGDRLFNKSIIARDGWILYTGDSGIPDYQHTDRMSGKDLRQLQRRLDRLDTYLRQEGRTLLVVIPPNKNTIYGQYMPQEIPVLNGSSRLDQFEAFMRANGKVRILDLRAALVDASRSETVYYKTDTHWTDAGAYIAYVEIMRALSADYPGLQPHPLSDFDPSFSERTMDLPRAIGMPQITEGSWELTPKFPVQSRGTFVQVGSDRVVQFTANPDPALPTLLIFHDSFYAHGLAKFMNPHFSHIAAVRFFLGDQPRIWSADWVRTQPSDIVIIELSERFLDFLSPLLSSFK